MTAQPLKDKIDVLKHKTLRQGNARDREILKTKSLPAPRTAKVHMKIVKGAGAVAPADGILDRARAVVYAVYKSLPMKEREGARDGRAVNRIQPALNIQEAKGLPRACQGLKYK
jgi:hypothetical protein